MKNKEYYIEPAVLTLIAGDNRSGKNNFLMQEFNRLSHEINEGRLSGNVVWIVPEWLHEEETPEAAEKENFTGPPMKGLPDFTCLILDAGTAGGNTPDTEDRGTRVLKHFQTLVRTGTIREKSIVIWDGPENFQHPAWQVRIAELLIQYAKAGIHLVIGTHSPYIVQGIRFFSHKNDVTPLYLLVERNGEGKQTVSDVTKDLNRVFLSFARPFNEIINLI